MSNGLSGLGWRLQALEKKVEQVDEHIERVETKVDKVREEAEMGRRGMTRAEKITATIGLFTFVGVITAVVALLQGAPT
jgi:uncharacterized membrane protein